VNTPSAMLFKIISVCGDKVDSRASESLATVLPFKLCLSRPESGAANPVSPIIPNEVFMRNKMHLFGGSYAAWVGGLRKATAAEGLSSALGVRGMP
jgi:hypothetical protein